MPRHPFQCGTDAFLSDLVCGARANIAFLDISEIAKRLVCDCSMLCDRRFYRRVEDVRGLSTRRRRSTPRRGFRVFCREDLAAPEMLDGVAAPQAPPATPMRCSVQIAILFLCRFKTHRKYNGVNARSRTGWSILDDSLGKITSRLMNRFVASNGCVLSRDLPFGLPWFFFATSHTGPFVANPIIFFVLDPACTRHS
jgi:hypothetical protein